MPPENPNNNNLNPPHEPDPAQPAYQPPQQPEPQQEPAFGQSQPVNQPQTVYQPQQPVNQQPPLDQSQSAAPQQQPNYPTPPLYGSVPQQPLAVSQKGRGGKKRLFTGIIAAVFVLLGASAAAYFGYYQPNQPENVWARALENSADGYDGLVEYADGRSENKKGEMKGTYKYDSGDAVVDGTIEARFDEKNSIVKADAGVMGTRFNLDMLYITPETSENPDVYFKVGGLKGIDKILGSTDPSTEQFVASFDNQWYVVDHTFFDQIEKLASQVDEAGATETITYEDGVAIAEAIGRANREHIFTSDESKAVLKRNQFVGKEELDGKQTYHYKVGYNKENLKSYIQKLQTELDGTKIKGYLDKKSYDEAIKSIDKMDGNGEADVWIDGRTKTFSKIRFTDKDSPDEYADIGMNYSGGDEVPFFIEIFSKEAGEDKFRADITLNTKTDELKIKSTLDSKEEDISSRFEFDATLKPTDEPVNIEKPKDAKNLMEAVGEAIGINPMNMLESAEL